MFPARYALSPYIKQTCFIFRGLSSFGGLEVPKFAGSNPAEAVGFLRAKKSSARLPSEGK